MLGALLVVGALASGLAHRSFLSLTAVFVVVGFALGGDGLDVLRFDPTSGFVTGVATVALVVILFRDGLEVEAEMLQRAWRLPLRKLAIAMPVTGAIVAVAAKLLTDLSWTECGLLGALLSPTDPVLSNAVVTNPRVPRVVRHTLNLESGLNDGLALAPVLVFLAALSADHLDALSFLAQDLGLGLAYGLAAGLLASVLMPRGTTLAAHQQSLYALGVAFATYGVTVAPPHANGFIAVFVCAIVLGIRRPDLREHFEERADDIIEIAKLAVFVVFGSLLTVDGLFGDGWAAAAVAAGTLIVARPVAVHLALLGSGLPAGTRWFMAWFGPKGVATMAFSLIVLGAGVDAGARLFNLAALTVFVSILAHGLTDTPGVSWLARRLERQRP